MRFLGQLWLDVRGTVLVVAQVITLGVIALLLGLLALNALLSHPTAPPAQPGPTRPLTQLVPTLLASTPTTTPGPDEPTEVVRTPTETPPPLYQPPGLAQSTPRPEPPPPTPTAAPPTAAPPARPAPTSTPVPPTPAPAGQPMKVLPSPDGLPARVRAEPKISAPILVRVPLGSTVEVIGQANGDEVQPGNRTWLRVRWRNTTGWIYSSLIGR